MRVELEDLKGDAGVKKFERALKKPGMEKRVRRLFQQLHGADQLKWKRKVPYGTLEKYVEEVVKEHERLQYLMDFRQREIMKSCRGVKLSKRIFVGARQIARAVSARYHIAACPSSVKNIIWAMKKEKTKTALMFRKYVEKGPKKNSLKMKTKKKR